MHISDWSSDVCASDLLRLGWGHGDDEIISTEQAIEWFDLDAVGKSAARFDFVKLENLNGHYLREAAAPRLVDEIAPRLEKQLGGPLTEQARSRLAAGMDGLKARAKTLVELAENAAFYVIERPLPLNPKAAQILAPAASERLGRPHARLEAATRSAETTSELQSLMRISYADF